MILRRILHPGVLAADRHRIAMGRGRRRRLSLKKGFSVNEAVTSALAEAGFESGYVWLCDVVLAPMRYVIPAASPDDRHAAWYSETHAPEGIVRVEQAGVIAGRRDGERFIHCHGLWTLASGARRMGHLLPHDSILDRDAAVDALGVAGAGFEAEEDIETGFKLFVPRTEDASADVEGARTIVCTIKPNEEIHLVIETICREHGIANAKVHGIGSLVGADFENGAHVASYATEVMVKRGTVRQTAEGLRSRLDIGLVGMDAAIAEGVLVRGQNTVCVTFELLIEETAGREPGHGR